MIKLLNKRLAILQWALGYWVFVKDTNPNPDENYGAAWYRMKMMELFLMKKMLPMI